MQIETEEVWGRLGGDKKTGNEGVVGCLWLRGWFFLGWLGRVRAACVWCHDSTEGDKMTPVSDHRASMDEPRDARRPKEMASS